MSIPPKFCEILSPRLGGLEPSLSYTERSSKMPEVKKPSAIIREQKILLSRLEQINQLCSSLKQKKLKTLESLKHQLTETNASIESQLKKNKESEQDRDNTLKRLYDKLYSLKNNNSQIIAKIESDTLKLSKIEQENLDLSITKQQLINQKISLEEYLNKIEASNITSNNKLSELTEKESIYKIIQESYEEAYQDYQKKRNESYEELKKLNNCLQELKGNIRVFCKIRPLLADDRTEPIKLEINDKTITVFKAEKVSRFVFDRVFGPSASIDEVFEEISQLVQSALDGYKVCIFAYGQTGSGKTYTMEGSIQTAPYDQAYTKGIIQKSMELMFSASSKLEEIGWSYKFYASTIEIYNEQVRDLLDYSKTLTGFSSSLINPISIEIKSYEDLVPLLIKARKNRAEAETECNINSSRSHFLFQLKIFGKKNNEITNGVLNLIDLAGSERLKISKAQGDRLEETKAINKSLSALGDVIHSLVKKEKHIPFRNSKLTYILQNCLGGDGKTLMFVNISPLAVNFKETLNSLIFARKVNACTLN